MKNKWKRLKELFFNLCFAFLILAIITFLGREEILTSLLLFILAVVGLVKWNSRVTLSIFLFIALLGSIIEAIGVYFNIWVYTIDSYFIFPIWMVPAWGNAAAFIYQTAIEFKRLGLKDK